MYTVKKLNSIPDGQVKVRVYDNGDIDLVSYATTVITVRDGWLECGAVSYSRTTIQHVGKFMREYGFGDYHLAKSLSQSGLRLNLNTGEVVSIK